MLMVNDSIYDFKCLFLNNSSVNTNLIWETGDLDIVRL